MLGFGGPFRWDVAAFNLVETVITDCIGPNWRIFRVQACQLGSDLEINNVRVGQIDKELLSGSARSADNIAALSAMLWPIRPRLAQVQGKKYEPLRG
jgi:hypothetical protein